MRTLSYTPQKLSCPDLPTKITPEAAGLKLLAIGFLATLTCTTAASAAQDLVGNGSFETLVGHSTRQQGASALRVTAPVTGEQENFGQKFMLTSGIASGNSLPNSSSPPPECCNSTKLRC